jgi:hypothetical protein
MSSAEDYEETDYAFVRGLFPPDWTPDPMPSAAWRGIVQENTAIDPDPAPSGRMEAPTVYAAWKIVYDEIEGDYEDEGAPVRYGRLQVARFIEKGARKGPLRLLRRAILRQLAGAPDEPLGFDIQAARSVTVGYIGPWFVENLDIPFAGG